MLDEQILQPQVEQAPVQPASNQPADPSKEFNFKQLRERAEKAELKSQELERQLKSVQTEIGDDDLVEGKHFKKMRSEFEQARQEIDKVRQQAMIEAAEIKLRARHTDIDEVLSENNLKELQQKYPAEFIAINATQDAFSKGQMAYNLIKNYGIAKTPDKEDVQYQNNKVKPKSAASLNTHPIDLSTESSGNSDRRILTEDYKARLREQVRLAKMSRP